MVENLKWNFLSNSTAETNQIPVQAIERIEVVRGPVSTAYGSALNGLVRIFLKRGENLKGPAGLIQVAYGEKNTHDIRAELSGSEVYSDYYFSTGVQGTDGIEPSRGFESFNALARLNIRYSPDSEFDFAIFYADPDTDGWDLG